MTEKDNNNSNKKNVDDRVCVNLQGVPRGLRQAFKVLCYEYDTDMTSVLIAVIENAVRTGVITHGRGSGT